MIKRVLLASAKALLVSLAVPPIANAQLTRAEEDVQVYPRSYFDKFNPQTARDFIDRLPGFTLDLGNEIRGFGGAAGNVLIDGERPSSKTGGVEDALKRVPANTVDRIEVIRGSAGAGEAAGQAVVANVIRATKDRSGSWSARLGRNSEGMNARGEVAISQRLGAWLTSANASVGLDRLPLAGTRISRDALGQPTLFQLEDSPSRSAPAAVSVDARRVIGDGVLTLNGRFGREFYNSNTERLGFVNGVADQSPDERLTIDFTRTIMDGEIGADWSRSLSGGWSLKVLALTSMRKFESEQLTFMERPVGSPFFDSAFITLQDSHEAILRSIASRGGKGVLRTELGGEVAFNKLESSLSLRVEDAGGASDIGLLAANVVVEELRSEAFANVIWQAGRKVSIEGGVGAELSEISVSGDARNTQSFFFVKPFVTLISDLRPGLQLRLGARRTVGQLDFADFAASASAADDRFTSGNPGLGPDQATRASLSVDWRSQTRGALNIEAFHEWRDDVLEQSILPSGGQGVANAGSARVWGVKTNASLTLSPLIPGGLIEVEGEFLDSTFDDPITDEPRSVSSIDSPIIIASFRQDLTRRRFSWGFSYATAFDGTFYFVDEESYNRDGRLWVVFVETTRPPAIKINLELLGVGRQSFLRRRGFFDPDRSGAFSGSEVISRDTGMFIRLTASGQF